MGSIAIVKVKTPPKGAVTFVTYTVRKRGLEPPPPKGPAPKAGASTISPLPQCVQEVSYTRNVFMKIYSVLLSSTLHLYVGI